MGVKSCFRTDCTNIMCDTHVPGVGYVCYECQGEFKLWPDSIGICANTNGKVLSHLKEFMDIPKSNTDSTIVNSIEEFFSGYSQ